ncbi:MAG TPA: hypothetical protein VFY75_06620 [Solirubrobacterales bacterium]|nr:hypothetical protein [Solirubrobacterales bacterium]
MLALAAIALAVAPASAPGETAEPTPTTETPPASTGWVPQGGASEGSGGGSSGAQQGSSLGSGSSPGKPASEPPAPPSEPPVATAPPPAPEPSTGSYEAGAQDPAASEPVTTPAPNPEPAPAEPAPKPSPPVDAHVALGTADAVLVGSGDVKGVSASSAAGTAAQIAPNSGGLPWVALIVFGLILVFAGVRLVFGPVEADSLRYSRFKFLRRAAPRG